MPNCWMESCQPSTGLRVSAVRRQFVAWLDPMGVTDELIQELALAVTEACSNAVLHGSPRGERDTFHVRCRFEEPLLVVEVMDHGPGFRYSGASLPDPLALEEHGRGLFLMAAMTDRMQVYREQGVTTVLLEKDLRRFPPGAAPAPHS
jgi:serine/threonine-protein kinase RsbW